MRIPNMITGLKRGLAIASIALVSCLPNSLENICKAQQIFENDGSSEHGFVPPPSLRLPPPPPANMASAESFIPYPPPPAQAQSRSEKKNPPTPPVMFVKLKSQYGLIDWASRPNDLNNLMQDMKKKINVNFASQCLNPSEINTDPDKNPIIYRTGHFHFSFTPTERKRFRDYMLNGGMVIFNTGMGSKPFFDSAKAEIAEIFPELKIQKLSPDDPILHAYYDLGQVEYRQGVRKAGYTSNEPLFYGVTIDCRTVAIISRWCMATGWDAVDDESIMGYSIKSAQELGINVMSYATAQRAWAKNISHAMNYEDADNTSAGKVSISQIMYDGNWKTRHAGLESLLYGFNRRTDIPVKFAKNEISLSDKKIFDSPILYITGHERFSLSEPELKNLREYVGRGGVLFAEACCGRKAFDSSFRELMKKVFPESSLEKIPLTDQIFKTPNNIQALEITPALSGKIGKTIMEPQLFAIKTREGYHGVIYSPYGMAGGWEMKQNPYGDNYGDLASSALGQNILMNIMTR